MNISLWLFIGRTCFGPRLESYEGGNFTKPSETSPKWEFRKRSGGAFLASTIPKVVSSMRYFDQKSDLGRMSLKSFFDENNVELPCHKRELSNFKKLDRMVSVSFSDVKHATMDLNLEPFRSMFAGTRQKCKEISIWSHHHVFLPCKRRKPENIIGRFRTVRNHHFGCVLECLVEFPPS